VRRFASPSSVVLGGLISVLVLLSVVFVAPRSAVAQSVNEIAETLERDGFYLGPFAEGDDDLFGQLVQQAESSDHRWYFVSLAESVSADFADDLFDVVNPPGNVLVYYLEDDFANVQLATDSSESVENAALAPFDRDWDIPEEFMSDVVQEYDRLASSSSSNTGAATGSGSTSGSSGGGFPWLLFLLPLLLIGGMFWFMSRKKKQEKQDDHLETAQKIRAELQTELEELANDVIVLSSPVDVSENAQAIEFYREATDTYLEISDELPDPEKLADADVRELSALGTRVTHARWQMDAAEAILEGSPLPEKPKVAPPPAPKRAPRPREEQRRRMPQRQARPRVPYSPSRRRSGGGLLDVLIAGAGMMGGRGGSGGGMFGGGRSRGGYSQPRGGGGMFGGRTQPRQRRQSRPRSGGGVFGGGGSRRSRSSNRTSRSSSRSSSRRSSSRGRSRSRTSTSRRKRR